MSERVYYILVTIVIVAMCIAGAMVLVGAKECAARGGEYARPVMGFGFKCYKGTV